MNFVPTPLSLPLFFLSRNRFQFDQPETVPNYIAKKRIQYTCRCNEENAESDVTKDMFRHSAGFITKSKTGPCPPKPMSVRTRGIIDDRPWHLAPNRYDVTEKPFDSYKGDAGAYWPKLHKSKSRKEKAIKPQPKFYNLDKSIKTCTYHKGVFCSNARERRATSRIMVESFAGCYRDPSEPGPSHYYPTMHEIRHNMFPVITDEERPNPYQFFWRTTAPDTFTYATFYTKNTCALPGPGRYENRYRHCHCGAKLPYQPELHILIDREKRKKFRRLPFKRIKASKFCAPDWLHVPGKGHRYLFNFGKKGKPKKVVIREMKKTEKNPLKLYPDARYIYLINNPYRVTLSHRAEEIIPPLPRIYYNCLAKRIVRKQLRNNKKIAFLSGQERFKDIDRPPTLTVKQLEAIKKKLPPGRVLTDHPVMLKAPEDIQSRLYETPKHMQPAYELELRKRLFKFLPLPDAKVLVTERDIRPKSVAGKVIYENFFGKPINPEDYFKPELRKSMQQGESK